LLLAIFYSSFFVFSFCGAGKVMEYGNPSKLLQDSTTMFASVVSEFNIQPCKTVH
jgi:hypothetical protein